MRKCVFLISIILLISLLSAINVVYAVPIPELLKSANKIIIKGLNGFSYENSYRVAYCNPQKNDIYVLCYDLNFKIIYKFTGSDSGYIKEKELINFTAQNVTYNHVYVNIVYDDATYTYTIRVYSLYLNKLFEYNITDSGFLPPRNLYVRFDFVSTDDIRNHIVCWGTLEEYSNFFNNATFFFIDVKTKSTIYLDDSELGSFENTNVLIIVRLGTHTLKIISFYGQFEKEYNCTELQRKQIYIDTSQLTEVDITEYEEIPNKEEKTTKTTETTGTGTLIVYVYDKQGHVIYADKVQVDDKVFENVCGIVVSLPEGKHTVKVTVNDKVQEKEVQVYANRTSKVVFYFDVSVEKYRLKVTAHESDTVIKVYRGSYLVAQGEGSVDKLLERDYYTIVAKNPNSDIEYRESIYLDSDMTITIPSLIENKTSTDIKEENDITTESKWFGVIVRVIDKDGNPVSGVTVYLQKSVFGSIGAFMGRFDTIAQAVTDSTGTAIITVNGTIDYSCAYRVYVEHDQAYANIIQLKQNSYVYVTLRVGERVNLANSPLQSGYLYTSSTQGQMIQVIYALIPLFIILVLINALTSMLRRR